jgi:integrase
MLFRDFRGILARANLPRVRLQDLRDSVASLLLAADAHPHGVMELLRHSSISMTTNTSGPIISPMMRNLADRMDTALGYGF